MSAIRALEGLLSGRRLVVCASAWQGLETVVGRASSATERARVQALKARVEITPDQVPARVASLRATRSLSARDVAVLGTGDSLGALTVTGNPNTVRAAEAQGVGLRVWVHPVRQGET